MTITSELAGRKIIITGAASGMGKAIARLFIEQGARTTLLDVNADGLKATAEGSDAVTVATDMSSPDAVKQAVDTAAGKMGGIDGLVNAAGILREIPFEQTDAATWQLVQSVNLFGPYLLCHTALPHLKAAEKGTIVNISSLAGLMGPQMMSAYAASKGGLIAFTKVLSKELAPKIRCNAIAPGVIRTGMTQNFWGEDAHILESIKQTLPMARAGEPEEIAELALFLTSDRSSFTTGATITCDGGRSAH